MKYEIIIHFQSRFTDFSIVKKKRKPTFVIQYSQITISKVYKKFANLGVSNIYNIYQGTFRINAHFL